MSTITSMSRGLTLPSGDTDNKNLTEGPLLYLKLELPFKLVFSFRNKPDNGTFTALQLVQDPGDTK